MGMDGRVLADRYAVGELLGRGGMAEVYLATDRVLDRPVAVKILGSWLAGDGTFVERFRREALAAARISHPNLVAVFDAGSEGDVHFIVMEHVPGETLRDVLRREDRIPPGRAAGIAASVGDALAVAHAARIAHRDVKPGNVMLTSEGRLKLMDLGIARGLDGEDIRAPPRSSEPPATSHRSRPAANPWTIARTSTPWAACSTRCSRAGNRSKPTTPWRSPIGTCTTPRPRPPPSSHPYRRRSRPWSCVRWRRIRRPGTRASWR